MELVTTVAELRERLAVERSRGRRIGLLATMGALHEGHLQNARLIARHAEVVVVSIFVNPTQFDRADDLAAYPRDLDADLAALASLGDDTPTVVFAPAVDQMYAPDATTSVHVGGLTEVLEGAARPGHFDGVATVVTKLLAIVGPDVTVFGRKDHQQLQVVRRLVADLSLPVDVLAAPTVREADGLALSSRNRRLDAGQRSRAVAIPSALAAAVEAAATQRARGTNLRPDELRAAAARPLAQAGLEVDYLAVVDPTTLRDPVGPLPGGARLCVAVAVLLDGVRLIDNVEVGDPDDEARLVAAVRGAGGRGPGAASPVPRRHTGSDQPAGAHDPTRQGD